MTINEMGGEAAVLRRIFKVGRYTVTMAVWRSCVGKPMDVTVEWYPDVPESLSDSQFRQYRLHRDAMFTELAAMLGGKVAIIEV